MSGLLGMGFESIYISSLEITDATLFYDNGFSFNGIVGVVLVFIIVDAITKES